MLAALLLIDVKKKKIMLIDIRKKKITFVNENYVKTDSSTHVHWSWKTEDKGFFFFFSPPVFQTENKKHILRGYIK